MTHSARNSILRNTVAGVVACALLSLGVHASAAEGAERAIVGTWKLMVDSQLGENERELVVKPDLTGTYGGGGFAAFPISNLKVDGDTATMDVTLDVDGTEVPSTITLKVAGDKVSGKLDYGQGEATIVGERAKVAIVGTWKLMVDSQLGENQRELVVKADMTGTYGGGGFAAFPISNLKVDGDTATMDVTLDVDGTEVPSTITLKVAGDKISGKLDYGQGEATIVGERAKVAIVGTWKLMVDSQLGENKRELVVKADMTGTYGGGGFAAFPISNLKVDGDTATMDVTLDVDGTEVPSTITLKLAGDKISGKLDYGQGEATIVGERE